MEWEPLDATRWLKQRTTYIWSMMSFQTKTWKLTLERLFWPSRKVRFLLYRAWPDDKASQDPWQHSSSWSHCLRVQHLKYSSYRRWESHVHWHAASIYPQTNLSSWRWTLLRLKNWWFAARILTRRHIWVFHWRFCFREYVQINCQELKQRQSQKH